MAATTQGKINNEIVRNAAEEDSDAVSIDSTMSAMLSLFETESFSQDTIADRIQISSSKNLHEKREVRLGADIERIEDDVLRRLEAHENVICKLQKRLDNVVPSESGFSNAQQEFIGRSIGRAVFKVKVSLEERLQQVQQSIEKQSEEVRREFVLLESLTSALHGPSRDQSQASGKLEVEGAQMMRVQLQCNKQFRELRELVEECRQSQVAGQKSRTIAIEDLRQAGMEGSQASAIDSVRSALRKAELQQQVDHAYLESALQSELQAERKWCAAEVQSVDMDLQASHGTQRALLLDTCRKHEAALHHELSESLKSLNAKLDGCMEEVSSKAAQRNYGFWQARCEHYDELHQLRQQVDDPFERLTLEASDFSEQRVAEMQEARHANNVAVCKNQAVDQLVSALESHKVEFQDFQRNQLVGAATTNADWKELIADVRDALSTKYMEGLKACCVAEEIMTSHRKDPKDVAAVVVEQLNRHQCSKAYPAPPSARCGPTPTFPSRTHRVSTPQHSAKWQNIQQARRTFEYAQ